MRSAHDPMRRDLQLDDEHGIDARSFDSMKRSEVGDFILEYRKTLSGDLRPTTSVPYCPPEM